MSEKNAKSNEIQELIKKAWNDEAFKAKLLTDTNAALKEHGIDVPAGVTIKAVENTANVIHILIPQKPTSISELSDEQLQQAAGGISSTYGTVIVDGTVIVNNISTNITNTSAAGAQ
ncbi:MAG: NHLP leader peptide family RiPP precursor [Nitrospirae bacterium]|nr:NHLP leader peptide family RiPP precursor [Nitrospirota bacterium]